MYDFEHPPQVGKTRGTLSETHPVMKIEVLKDGQWVYQGALLVRPSNRDQISRPAKPDIMLKAVMKPLPLRWDEQLATLASNAALNALGENHV